MGWWGYAKREELKCARGALGPLALFAPVEKKRSLRGRRLLYRRRRGEDEEEEEGGGEGLNIIGPT